MIFGLGAIVLDIGNWYVHKRHLQTQVDAAALAAASGFGSCFFDPTAANLAIASAALSYAGDTARDPSSVNQQVQSAGSVRVTLNSERYWAAGDPATPTTTRVRGSMLPTDPVGDNSAGTPCDTSTLDVKATDADVPKLFSWLGIRPDIKAHARVEIHEVKEESGFLPLAVPEIDPAYVYAIFVDYAKDGTQTPLKVQQLEKSATYGGSTFPYSAWVPKPESTVPGNTKVLLPGNTPTGVVILVSKSDAAPATTGTLNQICNQVPTDLVQCYAGTGSAGYDGAATGQGLAMIHGFADGLGAPDQPLLRDVQLTGMVCTGGAQPGNLSGPYYINDDSDCTVGVTREGGLRYARPSGRSHDRGQPKPRRGLCAGKRSDVRGNHRDRAVHLDVDRDDDSPCGRRPEQAESHGGEQDGAQPQQLQQPEPFGLGESGSHVVRHGRQLRPCRLRQADGDGAERNDRAAPLDRPSPMPTRPRAATTATRSTSAWISRWR